MNTKNLALSGLIAAIYAILTLLPPFSSLAFGMIQFRISEVLMALSLFTPAGVAGTTIGCLISNLIGAGNMFDIVFGTLATFLAGFVIYKNRILLRRHKLWMPLAVILFNSLIVGTYLPVIVSGNTSISAVFHALYTGNITTLIAKGVAPVGICMLSVGVGEGVVMYLLGVPFSLFLEQKKIF